MTDTVGQAPSGNPPSYLVQAMMQQYYNNLNNPQGANAVPSQGTPGANTQAASGYGALSKIINAYTQKQQMQNMMQQFQPQGLTPSDMAAQPPTMGSLGGGQ